VALVHRFDCILLILKNDFFIRYYWHQNAENKKGNKIPAIKINSHPSKERIPIFSIFSEKGKGC
jgi:hypothetical protein